MTDPRGRDRRNLSPAATSRGALTPIVAPRTGNAELDRFYAAVAQRFNMREGATNDYEAVVTVRDLDERLKKFGIPITGRLTLPNTPIPAEGAGVQVITANGSWASMSFEQFAESIRSTRLFKDLIKSLDDPTRFERLPQAVQERLLADLAKLDAETGARINHIEQIVSNADSQLAMRVDEVTANIKGVAAAGVRQVAFASASAERAIAGTVTQVTARLDDFDGAGATVEEAMLAIADRAEGLEAQWTLKVQAGKAIAGIGAAATENTEGFAESAIIIMADKFAVISSTDLSGITDPLNPPANRIPFGIDTVNNRIFLNGQVLINAGGTPLDALGLLLYVTADSQTFKRNADGSWDASSRTITASKGGGLSGSVTWSVIAGTYTGSLTGSGGSGSSPGILTVARADMSTDAVVFRATVSSGGITYTDDISIVKLADGENVLLGYLTNESHSLPADVSGNVSSFSGCGGTFIVYRGTTDVTASCTFSVVDNSDGVTQSIDSAGAYSVTAAGSWASSDRVATITYRATHTATGLNIDKVFTVTKANAGAAGSPGAAGTRGSLTLYRDISSSGYSATSWTDTEASLAVQAATGSLIPVLMDTVTLYNNTAGVAFTKYYAASVWNTIGVYINGNLLVTGTVAASAIAANQVFAEHYFRAGTAGGSGWSPNGYGFEVAGGTAYCFTLHSQSAIFTNTLTTGTSPLTVTTSSATGANAINALAAGAGIGVVGNTSHVSGIGVSGGNANTGSNGQVGTGTHDFYAAGTGTNYGPFTGAHDALVPLGAVLEVGDIVVDVECVARRNVSNTIFEVARCSEVAQIGVVGVVCTLPRPLEAEHPPAAMTAEEVEAHVGSLEVLTINAVGEGQINVCGRGGDLAAGDLIVASDMVGKGQRQGDSVVRGYTVAKSREAVTFSEPDEVKLVACFYLAG